MSKIKGLWGGDKAKDVPHAKKVGIIMHGPAHVMALGAAYGELYRAVQALIDEEEGARERVMDALDAVDEVKGDRNG